jgi:hypothetical protein
MVKPKSSPPASQPGMFATRIWHWRKKCYLNASNYGIKAFPIRRGR